MSDGLQYALYLLAYGVGMLVGTLVLLAWIDSWLNSWRNRQWIAADLEFEAMLAVYSDDRRPGFAKVPEREVRDLALVHGVDPEAALKRYRFWMEPAP